IFLLDMLDNLPRLWLSDPQMRAIMWVMKEIGGRDVPSLDTLCRVQEKLRKTTAISSTKYKSAQGNIFYVNDIKQQIAEVSIFKLLYPEDTPPWMSETWHAAKMCKEIQVDQLSPMVAVGSKHFYINELARCHDGKYVYP
ncbi:hypothetical protein M422DRAFT_81105, partial [Sphaerobolus stellatus SS14]